MEMNQMQKVEGDKEGRHELNEELGIPNDLHDIEWELKVLLWRDWIWVYSEPLSADSVYEYNLNHTEYS